MTLDVHPIQSIEMISSSTTRICPNAIKIVFSLITSPLNKQKACTQTSPTQSHKLGQTIQKTNTTKSHTQSVTITRTSRNTKNNKNQTYKQIKTIPKQAKDNPANKAKQKITHTSSRNKSPQKTIPATSRHNNNKTNQDAKVYNIFNIDKMRDATMQTYTKENTKHKPNIITHTSRSNTQSKHPSTTKNTKNKQWAY